MSTPVHQFTLAPLDWLPYVRPVRLADATDAQREAMRITPSNTRVSDYVLTLAHDPETLAVRSPLFNAIMYGQQRPTGPDATPGGLSRAGREMGAIGTSVFNRCIYCASIHAARFLQLTRRRDLVEQILADGPDATVDADWQPIFAFAVRMAESPADLCKDDMDRLRAIGLDELAIVDLVLSAAVFGWANRLMHTLGEAITPDDPAPAG
ncbi:peroxidase-related enzyme [Gluconacetobacter tumulicola]|uniref:Peroxidase-related enzyme n=1 Tax=Gluconacetobacter tumulicola TaxID=1017177 RepID=A0A7W4JGU8_9PROT|nr:peroxidase-related enzyme [Gluconacetobacter tumulicola]MBB2181030.1 peroxidase-related enzyme [Gluconacetobacter tumulicola]